MLSEVRCNIKCASVCIVNVWRNCFLGKGLSSANPFRVIEFEIVIVVEVDHFVGHGIASG